MKKSLGIPVLILAALAVTRPSASYGQDFFRDLGPSRSSGGFGPVVPSDYSYQTGSPLGLDDPQPAPDSALPNLTEDADRYNFAIGNIRFGLAAGVGIEWNDNITLSENDRISDFIVRPVVNLDAFWQFSELNTFRFNVGMSYAAYFQETQYNSTGVLISPTSELALTFFVGSVKFTLRNRFSHQEDVYDQPQLSNTAVYDRWENQAGIEMDWAINQAWSLALGYDHFNLWTSQEEFELQERAIDTIFVRPGVQLNPAMKIGVNASVSFINFTSDERSDGTGLLVGPYFEWQITDYTSLYLEGGYQSLTYDGASNYYNAAINQLGLSEEDAEAVQGILEDDQNSDNYYLKFEINNRPSEFFRHRLSYSRTTEIGFATNYYEIDHVEYSADWKISEHVEIAPTLFYEHYTTPGNGPAEGESADRFGAAIGIRYHLTNSITLGLDYRYLWKNSNLPGFDYYQNVAFLSIYYKF